ncbi:hypothetical protein ACEQPO_25415 [Bacillus sp. SL00103]
MAILDRGELVAQFRSKDDFFSSEEKSVQKDERCNARRPSFVPNDWQTGSIILYFSNASFRRGYFS